MSSHAVVWAATDLVSLGAELQSKIASVTQQFHARVQQAKSQEEAATLQTRLHNLVQSIQESFSSQVEATRDEVEELTKDLNRLMAPRNKLQLLRDMTVISYADGSVDEHEMQCLYWLSEGLRIEPGFIDHVLASAQQGVD